jgi:hypothetical protein
MLSSGFAKGAPMRKSIEGVTIIILTIGLTAFILYVINYDAGRDLVNSADEGNLKRVQSLLKKGVAVNARDFYGRTALSRATEKGRLEVVNAWGQICSWPI